MFSSPVGVEGATGSMTTRYSAKILGFTWEGEAVRDGGRVGVVERDLTLGQTKEVEEGIY